MAFKTKNNIILRNPSEKAKRYSRQLRNNRVAETGKTLSKEDRAYRGGYLDARKDNAKAYCHKNGIKSKAKPYRRGENYK